MRPRGIDTEIPILRAVEDFEMAKIQYAVYGDAMGLLDLFTKQVAVTAVAYVEGSVATAADLFGMTGSQVGSFVNQMRRPTKTGVSRPKEFETCIRGHDLSDPMIGRLRGDGRGKYCAECARVRERERARVQGKSPSAQRGPNGATHCKRGHEFTEKNTNVCKKSGKRSCKACAADRQRARRDAKKGQLSG